MEASLSYRLMKPGEESAACALVTRVFMEFVAPGYTEDGVEEFLAYADPNLLLERSDSNHLVLVAEVLHEIVGVIEVRGYSHISLLFVDSRYHRIGIAGELLRRAVQIGLAHKPGLLEMSVNSSPYAEPIYGKLGFRVTEPEQTVRGIRFVPMVLEVTRLRLGAADGNDRCLGD